MTGVPAGTNSNEGGNSDKGRNFCHAQDSGTKYGLHHRIILGNDQEHGRTDQ